MAQTLDSEEFRRILGHYPTGVCAVTALGPSGPVGLVVGSFTSVSLEPALVAFLPDRGSNTWPKIEAAGHFCVNILVQNQLGVCKALASKAENNFDAIPYQLSGSGLPLIEDVVAWIDCQLYAVHEAGDHFIAIGRVLALDVEGPEPPLVFLRAVTAASCSSRRTCGEGRRLPRMRAVAEDASSRLPADAAAA